MGARGRRALAVIAILTGLLTLPALTGHTTHASASTSSIGVRVLEEAQTRVGDWYSYGAAGPSAFDCSGLVYWAAHQVGVNLPRTSYGMMYSSMLYRVSTPEPGDLAVFAGGGHVEIVSWRWHATLGALHSGTVVGWHAWNGYWGPVEFLRFRLDPVRMSQGTSGQHSCPVAYSVHDDFTAGQHRARAHRLDNAVSRQSPPW